MSSYQKRFVVLLAVGFLLFVSVRSIMVNVDQYYENKELSEKLKSLNDTILSNIKQIKVLTENSNSMVKSISNTNKEVITIIKTVEVEVNDLDGDIEGIKNDLERSIINKNFILKN